MKYLFEALITRKQFIFFQVNSKMAGLDINQMPSPTYTLTKKWLFNPPTRPW